MLKTRISFKKTIVLLIGAIIVLGILYFWYQDKIKSQGRLYSNKQEMCTEFALSYLRTVQNKEAGLNNKKLNIAIDIETEIYNICMLDLKTEDLKNYSPKSFKKY